MLEWDNLRYMLAIHRRGSMQAAADELGIDRATVLRRLDALEAGLKVRLFDRGREGCEITPAGQEILGTVEGIEQAMTSLAHRVRGRDEAAEGRGFQDERQGSRTKFRGQTLGFHRNPLHEGCGGSQGGNQERQGFAVVTPFEFYDPSDAGERKNARAQAVDGLGRKRHDPARR